MGRAETVHRKGMTASLTFTVFSLDVKLKKSRRELICVLPLQSIKLFSTLIETLLVRALTRAVFSSFVLLLTKASHSPFKYYILALCIFLRLAPVVSPRWEWGRGGGEGALTFSSMFLL